MPVRSSLTWVAGPSTPCKVYLTRALELRDVGGVAEGAAALLSQRAGSGGAAAPPGAVDAAREGVRGDVCGVRCRTTFSSPTMPDLHFAILPPPQRGSGMSSRSARHTLREAGITWRGARHSPCSSATGSRSISTSSREQAGGVEGTEAWLQEIPATPSGTSSGKRSTAEIDGVKLSFIGGLQYPLVGPQLEVGGIRLAGPLDIGLMKLLAISHRATRGTTSTSPHPPAHCPSRSCSGRARQVRDGVQSDGPGPCADRVRGSGEEMPVLLDEALAATWQEMLRRAVRSVAGE